MNQGALVDLTCYKRGSQFLLLTHEVIFVTSSACFINKLNWNMKMGLIRSRMFIAAVFLFCSAFKITAIASERNLALPASLSFEENFGPEINREIANITNSSLILVEKFPPPDLENHFFSWNKDRAILNGKSFSIVFAKSDSSFMRVLNSKGAGGVSPNTDALTIAPIDPTNKKMPIFICIFVDKIFYDEFGNPRSDSLARLVLALAHEIYGNVQHFLEMSLENVSPMTMEMRIDQEIRSFTKSVQYLENLFTHPEFKKFPEKTQAGLKALLPKEKEALRTWQSAWTKHCRKLLVPGDKVQH